MIELEALKRIAAVDHTPKLPRLHLDRVVGKVVNEFLGAHAHCRSAKWMAERIDLRLMRHGSEARDRFREMLKEELDA